MTKTCIIVVPVYKKEPDELETLSFKQLDSVVTDIDICLIHPQSNDIVPYKEVFNNNDVLNIPFDDSFFTSLESYSRLCLKYDFYKAFEEYEYMLMYQPDCWIFRNDIINWCGLGYDYVGGPIYSRGSNWPSLIRGNHPMVGNGGLSLRKMTTMLKITNPDEYVYKKHTEEWDNITYEDMFICDVVAHEIYMNIPDYKMAEFFSIDFPPLKTEHLNPMALHRVFVCYETWKNRIDILNDPHIQELCEIEKKKTYGHYNHNDKQS